jgi:parallel beta-helix repeat protein
VDLECAGHKIAAAANYPDNILVTNAQEVGISRCVAHNPKENYGNGLAVSNSKGVRIVDNDFENVNVSGSLYTFAANNHILGVYYQQQTSWTDFRNNDVVAYSDIYIGAPVGSNGGSYNQIVGNTIDGKWDGVSPNLTQGADDGMNLGYEHDDQIRNNTIQNVWDEGIEPFGTLSNTIIADNQISNTRNAGIGAFINLGWVDNTISGNQAKNAGQIVGITFVPGSSFGPVPTTAVFQDNQILNNVLSSPRIVVVEGVTFYPSMTIEFPQPSFPITVLAGNNRITGNILPTNMSGPLLTPSSAFIDGGGNHCGPPPPGTTSPIKCLP